MSLRDDASYVFGPSFAKFIPKNTDGSTALPYPGKTEVSAFSGLGPFDFSGATAIATVSMTIKNNTVVETKDLDLSAAVDPTAVTAAELVAAITAATFTGVTASVDSRGYGKIVITAGDAETDYLQVYGEAALLAEFGWGYGLKFLTMDTLQSFPFTPTNVDDEKVEMIDSNGKKVAIIAPGYREGVAASLVDTAVDNELRALLTGGTYDTAKKEYIVPVPDSYRPLLSIEVTNKMYLKDTNQDTDYVGVKLSRAFNMSSKETSAGDGARAFQTMGYDFAGVPYTNPETNVKYGDSMTKDYTVSEYGLLDYESI